MIVLFLGKTKIKKESDVEGPMLRIFEVISHRKGGLDTVLRSWVLYGHVCHVSLLNQYLKAP